MAKSSSQSNSENDAVTTGREKREKLSDGEIQKKRKWDSATDEKSGSKNDRNEHISRKSKLSIDNRDDESSKPSLAFDEAKLAAEKLNKMLGSQNSERDDESTNFTDRSVAVPRVNRDIEIVLMGDKEYMAKFDINDFKYRYALTKSQAQEEIAKVSGAIVKAKGKYYPDRSLSTEKEPPLYLLIIGPSVAVVETAITKTRELMEEAILAVNRPDPTLRSKYFTAKVVVGIETERNFNPRAKIVGPAGAYVKHIQQQTNCKVQLRGRGSGYEEKETGCEAPEPLYVNITCNSQENLDKAVQLCKDLVETVKREYENFKSNNTGGRNNNNNNNNYYPASGYNMYAYGMPYQQYAVEGMTYGYPPEVAQVVDSEVKGNK